MTIKQRVLIGSMILGFSLINVTIVSLSHSLHAHVGVLISFLGSMIFVIGRWVGALEKKWERDKEFAKIIADRLLRRPHDNAQTQSGNQANLNPIAGWNQQMSNMNAAQGGQAIGIIGVGNSLGLSSILGGGDGSGLGKQ